MELDSQNVKALFRRSQAYTQLADLELAEIDIKKALEIDPDNRVLQHGIRFQNLEGLVLFVSSTLLEN